MVTALAATAGQPISRQAARQLARQELAKSMYRQRTSFLTWLHDQLSRLFDSTNADVPGGWWAVVALIALAVIVVALVLARVGPVARSRRREALGPLRGPVALTAREHREIAERNAATGDYSGAIEEYLRAVAAGLEERAILRYAPGRTAGELAAQAGRLLPGHAAGLGTAARLFDDVRYGGRPGTAANTARLRDLEAAIRASQPAMPARATAGSA
jgi:Domain of unknown function (DUF4129)